MIKTILCIFLLANIGLAHSSLIRPQHQQKNIDNNEKLDANQCLVCKLIVAEVEELLQNSNSTVQLIVKELQTKLCPVLGPQLTDICSEIVQVIVPVLLENINGEITPAKLKKLCSTIKLCPKHHQPKLPIKAGNKCTECKDEISLVELALRRDGTEQEVIGYVQKYCDALPENVRVYCQSLVFMYGTYFYRYTTQLCSDPLLACTSFGKC